MTNKLELIQYDISKGVERIDGAELDAGQTTIMLTETQAAYDVAQGRLVKSKPKRPPKKQPPQPDEPELLGDETSE